MIWRIPWPPGIVVAVAGDFDDSKPALSSRAGHGEGDQAMPDERSLREVGERFVHWLRNSIGTSTKCRLLRATAAYRS